MGLWLETPEKPTLAKPAIHVNKTARKPLSEYHVVTTRSRGKVLSMGLALLIAACGVAGTVPVRAAGGAAAGPAPAADFVAQSNVWSVHLSRDGRRLAYLTEAKNEDAIGIASLENGTTKEYVILPLVKNFIAGTQRVMVGMESTTRTLPTPGGGLPVSVGGAPVYARRPIIGTSTTEQNAFGVTWLDADRLLVNLNTGWHTFTHKSGALDLFLDLGREKYPSGLPFRRLMAAAGCPTAGGQMYFVATRESSKRGPDLLWYDEADERLVDAVRNPGDVRQWYVGDDENSVLGIGAADGVGWVFLRDPATGEWAPSVELGPSEDCRVIGYDTGNRRLHMLRRNGDRTVVGIMDVGAKSWVGEPIGFPLFDALPRQAGPRVGSVDLSGLVLAGSGGRLLGVRSLCPLITTTWIDAAFAGYQAAIDQALPGLSNMVIETDDAEERLLVLSVSGTEPGFFSIFETATGKVRRMFPVRDKPPAQPRASVRPVRFTAGDGTSLFGWITLPPVPPPNGKKVARPLVVLLNPTPGEPWAGTYDELAQFVASRGYVVLQVNHRGTRGRGEAFLEQGRAGLGSMVPDDLSAAVDQLVASGHIDGSRVAVIGSGYGGHLALRALVTGKFASGIAISPVVDWATFKDSKDVVTRRWLEDAGQLDAEDAAASATKLSAVTFAQDLRQPCLLIQGADQEAVSLKPVNEYVKRLKKAGSPIESVVIKGASDNIPEEKPRAEMFEQIEKFLARILAGGTPAR